MLQSCQYDQLNCIVNSSAYYAYNSSTQNSLPLNTGSGTYFNKWNIGSGQVSNGFTTYSYDANGNILTLNRNRYDLVSGSGAYSSMDQMAYTYKAESSYNTPGLTAYKNTNKLDDVTDASTTASGAEFLSGQSAGNYDYDEIGNLQADAQEQIANITWNVYGKIESITRNSGSTKNDLEYRYDAHGNRLVKIVKPRTSSGPKTQDNWVYTYYVRDAQGNVMNVYSMSYTNPSSGNYVKQTSLKESHLYGSARLGLFDRTVEGIGETQGFTSSTSNFYTSATGYGTASPTGNTGPEYFRKLGTRELEMSNHLGNVQTVVSDKKIPLETTGDNIVDYCIAEILNTNDYYAFGQAIPGRSFVSSTGAYRYGMNGKEKDDEIVGSGDSYDFGARQYDSRIGRWMSSDPLASKYPMDSPYMFAGNSPISVIDPDGEEKIVIAASDHHNNTWKFLNSALRQLRQYRGSDDTRTLVLLNNGGFYSKGVTKAMGILGKVFGFNVISVSNTKEVVNYINGTTVNAHGLKRTDDPITSVDIFAHGTPSQIHSDYSTDGNTVLDKSLAKEIKPESFEDGATFSSYACRTGASIDLPKAWNPFVDNDNIDNQIKINGSNESLAQSMADNLGIQVNAFMSRTEYGGIYGDLIFRKTVGDDLFKATKGVDGKKGALYLLGAPYGVKGATETSAVNPGMFKFTKGKKPTLIK